MASSKAKTVFYCKECGYESSKWMGQCPGCRQWNTFVEAPSDQSGRSPSAARGSRGTSPVLLRDVASREDDRTGTGFNELDRVLGGGIVKGSLVLIGGDPGIGKSTILLQMCQKLAADGHSVLYVSGEESPAQIRMRADRLGGHDSGMYLLCETDLGNVRETITRMKPGICVIDSIQTMYSSDAAGAPGSVSQVREATGALMMLAKGLGVSIFIVGHVTKEGAVAGPRVLEHMVDTVLYFEGDRHASYRIIRGVKNRFGSTDEIGVFEMGANGLEEVPNPSEYMLNGRPEGASGSIVACTIEGTRPMLIEIQALLTKTAFGVARRTTAGTDYNRVNLLLAVLEKRCRLELSTCDAYINITGGVRLYEPALDLGILLAVVSSYHDFVIGEKVMAFGEVGLAGEIRAVSAADIRLQEAKRLGFETVIFPAANMKSLKNTTGIRIIPVGNIKEAIAAISVKKGAEKVL